MKMDGNGEINILKFILSMSYNSGQDRKNPAVQKKKKSDCGWEMCEIW